MDKSQKTNDNFCCSKCGVHFDLSTNFGRKAARYGFCRRCGIELVLSAYKESNFIAKIIFFIPYLIIKRSYNKTYKKIEIDAQLDKMSSEPIVPSMPKFNHDFTEFTWNGIVYYIPEKYYGKQVDVNTMNKIAHEIIEMQDKFALLVDAELKNFEQNEEET